MLVRVHGPPWMASLALTVMAALLMGAAPVVVEAHPADLTCPDEHAVRVAVEERLRGLVLEGDGAWRASYRIDRQAATPVIDLVLLDPSGTRRLARRLPIDGTRCETMAQVIAVVLERFFRDLGALASPSTEPPSAPPSAAGATSAATPRPPTAPTSASPTAPTSASPAAPTSASPAAPTSASPAAPTSTSPAASGAPTAPPPTTRASPSPAPNAPAAPTPPSPSATTADLVSDGPAHRGAARSPGAREERVFRAGTTSWAVGGAVATPIGDPAIAVDAKVWLTRHWAIGVQAAFPNARLHEAVGPSGAVEATIVPVRWSGVGGQDFGWGYLYGGPDLLVSFDQGSTSGIARTERGLRTVWALGLTAGLLVWVRRPVALTVQGAVERVIPTKAGQFMVGGDEVLRPSDAAGTVLLGVTFVVTP